MASTPSQNAASTSSSLTPNPTTPAYTNDLDWITAYLTIHSASPPSYRYEYILWLFILLIFILFAILHWTGRRGGFIGALWSKWALRRRTWRKKHSLAAARKAGQPHRQPYSLPSNAQILSLFVLFVGVALLSTLGPDYIAPSTSVWDFTSNATVVSKRDIDTSTLTPYIPQYTISKAFWTSSARTGDIAFALLPLCVLFALKAPPFAIFALPFMIQVHFDKLVRLHRWAGRLIWLISAVHVGLWSVQLAMDHRVDTGKTAWSYAFLYDKFVYGWIAFVLLTLLIVFSILPMRSTHYEAFYFLHVLLVPLMIITAALHHPPIWWWCWAALGLWVGERIWRGTWWIYVNGVFGLPVGSMKNTKQAAAAVVTPFVDAVEKRVSVGKPANWKEAEEWEMKGFANNKNGSNLEVGQTPKTQHIPSTPVPNVYSPSPFSPGTPAAHRLLSYSTLESNSLRPDSKLNQQNRFSLVSPLEEYTPPPGYAHIVILPGHSLRIRLVTPEFFTWAPGQHFLMNIPHISMFTSHPFTTASICDLQEQSPLQGGGCELVFIVRAKSGWTHRLFECVKDMIKHGEALPAREKLPPGYTLPPLISNSLPPTPSSPSGLSSHPHPKITNGVLLRTFIDGPFGSSARAKWGSYSTALIVCGGSGVSFGVSVLQYLCLCLAGRDGKTLGGRPGGWGVKGFKMRRVRFVWVVREYAHIQWCATALRQCSALIPNEGLEINICVTNFQLEPVPHPTPLPSSPSRQRISVQPNASSSAVRLDDTPHINIEGDDFDFDYDDEPLTPPTRPFAQEARHSRASGSQGSFSSGLESTYSSVDLSYYFNDATPYTEGEASDRDREDWLGHEEHMLDYTNFDGDNDTALPGENRISLRVRRQSQRVSAMSAMRRFGERMLRHGGGSGSGSGSHLQYSPGKHKEKARGIGIGMEGSIMESDAEHEEEMSDREREKRKENQKNRKSKYKSGMTRPKAGDRTSVQSTDRLLTSPTRSTSPDQHSISSTEDNGRRLSRQRDSAGSGGWLSRALHSDDEADETTPTFSSFAQKHSHSHTSSLPPPPFHPQVTLHQPHASTSWSSPLASSVPITSSRTPSLMFSISSKRTSASTLVGPYDHSGATTPTPQATSGGPAVHFAIPPTPDSPGRARPTISTASASTITTLGGDEPDVYVEMTRQEARDLKAVSEFARPGRPRLARILADEVERSSGSVVVACCGPTSLNALMRKTISAQIDPKRVLRGDMRGSIAFVSEDFEY